MEFDSMMSRQRTGSSAEESDSALPPLPVAIGPSLPVYPTVDGVFNRAYGCAGDEAQRFERVRIETALALTAEQLAEKQKRDQVHEVLEEASTDFFENMPPALVNAFLYAKEHELGPALFNAAAHFRSWEASR